ncbi:MAG: phosphatidylglycerol lysyltransferase domain-containing protein [Lentisphaerota bacterium]
MDKTLLLDYLKLYGSHTIAFSAALDDKMKPFYLPDKGFILYGTYKNIRFMLGDPLCSKENMAEVVKAFIADTNAASNILIGMQCGFEAASVFAKNGFSVNSMGVETILFLDTFDTKGKAMTKVRRWINSGTNAGLEVKEENLLDPKIKTEVERISAQWLEGKATTSELNLLTRPLSFEEQPGLRFFCGYLAGKIIAYNTFEPMYKDSKVIGYYANICRVQDDAPNGALDLIMQKAREKFKTEGVKYFSLGLSPMADIKDEHKLHNPIVSFMLESSYRYGSSLYSFQGLDFHKKAYHDEINSIRQPSYLVIKGSLPVNQIINSLSYLGILPNQGFVSNLSYLAETMIKGFYDQNKTKFQTTEQDIKGAVSGLLGGLSNKEISQNFNCSGALVENLANAFTSMWKQKLPEFQEKLYIQRDLDEVSRDIFARVENIVDRDKDVLFLYNIGIHPVEKGYYVMMTVEVEGKLTINKANFIVARLKDSIKKNISSVVGVFVETAPVGQYAYKIGLKDDGQKNFIV